MDVLDEPDKFVALQEFLRADEPRFHRFKTGSHTPDDMKNLVEAMNLAADSNCTSKKTSLVAYLKSSGDDVLQPHWVYCPMVGLMAMLRPFVSNLSLLPRQHTISSFSAKTIAVFISKKLFPTGDNLLLKKGIQVACQLFTNVLRRTKFWAAIKLYENENVEILPEDIPMVYSKVQNMLLQILDQYPEKLLSKDKEIALVQRYNAKHLHLTVRNKSEQSLLKTIFDRRLAKTCKVFGSGKNPNNVAETYKFFKPMAALRISREPAGTSSDSCEVPNVQSEESANCSLSHPSSLENNLEQVCWQDGKICQPAPTLMDARNRVQESLQTLRSDHKRNLNPTPYKVAVSNWNVEQHFSDTDSGIFSISETKSLKEHECEKSVENCKDDYFSLLGEAIPLSEIDKCVPVKDYSQLTFNQKPKCDLLRNFAYVNCWLSNVSNMHRKNPNRIYDLTHFVMKRTNMRIFSPYSVTPIRSNKPRVTFTNRLQIQKRREERIEAAALYIRMKQEDLRTYREEHKKKDADRVSGANSDDGVTDKDSGGCSTSANATPLSSHVNDQNRVGDLATANKESGPLNCPVAINRITSPCYLTLDFIRSTHVNAMRQEDLEFEPPPPIPILKWFKMALNEFQTLPEYLKHMDKSSAEMRQALLKPQHPYLTKIERDIRAVPKRFLHSFHRTRNRLTRLTFLHRFGYYMNTGKLPRNERLFLDLEMNVRTDFILLYARYTMIQTMKSRVQSELKAMKIAMIRRRSLQIMECLNAMRGQMEFTNPILLFLQTPAIFKFVLKSVYTNSEILKIEKVLQSCIFKKICNTITFLLDKTNDEQRKTVLEELQASLRKKNVKCISRTMANEMKKTKPKTTNNLLKQMSKVLRSKKYCKCFIMMLGDLRNVGRYKFEKLETLYETIEIKIPSLHNEMTKEEKSGNVCVSAVQARLKRKFGNTIPEPMLQEVIRKSQK